MTNRNRIGWRLMMAAIGCGALFVAAMEFGAPQFGTVRAVAQEAPAAADEEYEALARGAVHEAFAEPVVFDPEPGEVVAKQPPEAIEELPPDTKPEGDNVVWISGYWNWDEDRDNFVWISGFWRDIPPGREWVEGYWTKAPEGWQWVAGYWASNEEEEVQYLPNPPATLEVGPASPAPSTGHMWMPGCWMWRDVRYVWRPGYWVVGRPNWVWVPSRYVWTPGGFVFVNGYWDMPVQQRGMLFAPVFFSGPVYTRPSYRYSPAVVVNLSLFTSHLWVRPSMGCYYFGDYYATQYGNRGFYPWHTYHSGHHGYDPIYVQSYHQHVHIEKHRDWANHLQRDYAGHVEHVDTRPARSFSHLAVAGAAGAAGGGTVASLGLVSSLKQVSNTRDLPVKLQKIDDDKRQEFVKKSKEAREFTKEREKQEKIAGVDRPMPPRKGRPDRAGETDANKVGKGIGPKLEGPKVVGGEGPKVPGAKDAGTPGEKPNADQTVRKMGRPRSPLGDKGDKNATVKRDVPPRLDIPGSDLTTTGDKSPPSKTDAVTPGRDKPAAGVLGKPKRGDTPDVGDKPNVVPRVDTPKGKPRETPRFDTPKGKPKFDLPKTAPKVDEPKSAPKFDKPRSAPKADAPRSAPKTEAPRSAPKTSPPRTETPRNPTPPPRTRSEPSGNPQPPRAGGSSPPRSEPRNDPPKKGRNEKNEKKDRGSTAGVFSADRESPIRPAARLADTQPAPRFVRPEPQAEPRMQVRSEPRNERAEPRVNRSEPAPNRTIVSGNRAGNRVENANDGAERTDAAGRRDRRRP